MTNRTPAPERGEDPPRPDYGLAPELLIEAEAVTVMGLRLGLLAEEWSHRYQRVVTAIEDELRRQGVDIAGDFWDSDLGLRLSLSDRGAAGAYYAIAGAFTDKPDASNALDRATLQSLLAVPDGHCVCDLAREHPELHDQLVTFERDGVAGVYRLLDHLDDMEICEIKGLSWLDLDRFAAEHRWQDPWTVCQLLRLVRDLFRFRRDAEERGDQLRTLTMGLQSVTTVAATTLGIDPS